MWFLFTTKLNFNDCSGQVFPDTHLGCSAMMGGNLLFGNATDHDTHQ
ncbi:hypothetical protein Dd1591_0937 [Dickeya chrysanthemi Ech1591]|uniref:Uncharacterized protein n=1 Tax=Dickeya chrysanthemi (strain Ech1591) TaxID=561229 RepID=C6CMN9_DICC1|nr:hypothetical protein Dd1591_0937 [Dickeya chrysanthemi Ech1591]